MGFRDKVRCSSWAHWKARSRLPVSVNWTLFTRCYSWGTTGENRSKVGDFAPTWSTIYLIDGFILCKTAILGSKPGGERIHLAPYEKFWGAVAPQDRRLCVCPTLLLDRAISLWCVVNYRVSRWARHRRPPGPSQSCRVSIWCHILDWSLFSSPRSRWWGGTRTKNARNLVVLLSWRRTSWCFRLTSGCNIWNSGTVPQRCECIFQRFHTILILSIDILDEHVKCFLKFNERHLELWTLFSDVA